MAEIAPFRRNWIDGAWLDGSAGQITVTYPATGEALAEQALANAADVDRAVTRSVAVKLKGCQ